MKEFRIFPEPWRVKTVERIALLPREERLARLKAGDWNLFRVPARDVFIDLLTDSGTSAMSDAQWGALMQADESYACARSWEHFEAAAVEVTGYPHILPVHQGRAAEHLLFGALLKKGDFVPSNNHFDTTRANIEALGAAALDLVIAEGRDPRRIHPFKGNMDVEKLESLLSEKRDRVPFCMLTVTNNTGGGQPVAMENIARVAGVCRRHGVPLFLDACRYAENAYFIRIRDERYGAVSIPKIAREMFAHADGCLFSAKKDGLANMGGFLAFRGDAHADAVRDALILKEGFPTYGGMSGRDLEAAAVGLREAQDEEYLRFRIEQVRLFGEMLKENGAHILEPAGGHAVYLDALRMLPHLPQEALPAQALAVALYLEGGVRGVEIGSVMFAGTDPKTGKPSLPPMELVRLAVPRRVYSNDHLAYTAEVAGEVMRLKERIPGFKITWEPPRLRHFTARLAPLLPMD